MDSYDTMTEAINALHKEGYVEDFNLKNDGIECQNRMHEPSEFKIDKIFRFEDNTDPSDQAVLYAISSDRYQLKGVLVNAYGLYSDPIAGEMMAKLKMR